MAAKFKSKAWLQNLTLSDFNKFVEYILGERVNGIKTSINGVAQPLRPPWSIVLDYEFKLRKEAFKLVVRGQSSLKEALEAVIKDSELKESFFVTPLTLASHEHISKYQRTSGKGNSGQNLSSPVGAHGKGKSSKGKNYKKGKGKSGFKGDTALVSQTPDGRDICYACNAQGCAGKCGRVHCCRVRGCFGQHSAREHHLNKKERGKSPTKPAAAPQEWLQVEHDSTEKKDTVFRVLYLFCGKPRKSDLRAWLTRLAPGFKCTVHVREVDIARSSEDDLSGEGLWQKFFTEVAEGKWDAVFLSPPCNTFSRARHLWKRSPGPRPIRSKHYPYGFPWVSAANKQTLGEHNFFIFQCKRMATTAFKAGKIYLWEHPEDLGRVKDTDDAPGSIWQWDELRTLQLESDATTWAIYQCHFGADTPKPTRFLGNIDKEMPHSGWPTFDAEGFYSGPLGAGCGHRFHVRKLIGKTKGVWNTSPSAAYPSKLCKYLAQLLLSRFVGGRTVLDKPALSAVDGPSQVRPATEEEEDQGHTEGTEDNISPKAKEVSEDVPYKGGVLWTTYLVWLGFETCSIGGWFGPLLTQPLVAFRSFCFPANLCSWLGRRSSWIGPELCDKEHRWLEAGILWACSWEDD